MQSCIFRNEKLRTLPPAGIRSNNDGKNVLHMEKVIDKTTAPAKAKLLAPAVISAVDNHQADLLQSAFDFFLNQFSITSEIEQYCSVKGIDPTYLGFTNGQFYKTVSKRHKSFTTLQKMGLLNKEGKDKYKSHLVVPVLDGTL